MACILVVDDDDDLRESIADALRDAGHEVVEASNGRVALEQLRRLRPSVVFLDLMMPVVDGWQVVEEMRARPELAAIPICVVSATTSPEPPVTDYALRKPVDLADLLRVALTASPAAGS